LHTLNLRTFISIVFYTLFKINIFYTDTDCLDRLCSEDAIEVLRLSRRFNIDRLYNYSARFCRQKIANENAVSWFIDADKYDIHQLRESTKRYIAINFDLLIAETPCTLDKLLDYASLMMEIWKDPHFSAGKK
jgi:hypothetical protein